MPSSLLALAKGALEGGVIARERKRKNDREDLQQLIELGNNPGITLEPLPGPPGAPKLPPPPAMPTAIGGMAGAADMAGLGPKAPAAPPAPAPSSAMEVGKTAIGGTPRRIMYDPTQSPAGKARAQEARNIAAHARLTQSEEGGVGDYDSKVDYVAHEAKKADEARIVKTLVAQGMTKEDAQLYAEHHIDMATRRRQASADLRAEIRQSDLEAQNREAMDERKRHNRATEGAATQRINKTAATSRHDLAAVEGQIHDTQRDLTGATKLKPKKPLVFLTPEDSTDYEATSDAADSAISRLKNRSDSLSTVRDSIAADIQQGTPKTPIAAGKKAIAGLLTPAPATKAGELAAAKARYDRLVANPKIDKARAKTAYDQTVAGINKKYGAK